MHDGAERIHLDVENTLMVEELPKVILRIVSIVVHQERLGMKQLDAVDR
jgi:hypothetical protein